MAKHMIYPHPLPGGANADRRVELQWQRGGDVRIATSRWAGDGEPDPELDYLGDRSTSGGLPVAWPGEYVELDRDQVNHLIRQLREARNQAYGRDE
jgi:hypothetical protein